MKGWVTYFVRTARKMGGGGANFVKGGVANFVKKPKERRVANFVRPPKKNGWHLVKGWVANEGD